jgi:hypothetical protein
MFFLQLNLSSPTHFYLTQLIYTMTHPKDHLHHKKILQTSFLSLYFQSKPSRLKGADSPPNCESEKASMFSKTSSLTFFFCF